MCSTVTFRYSCGCTEIAVFECLYSSSSHFTSQEKGRTRSCSPCSRRHRRRQRKLTEPGETRPAATGATPSRNETSVPAPSTLSLHQTARPEEPESNERFTEVSELCHTCWQLSQLPRKLQDEDALRSRSTTQDVESVTDAVNSTDVLREISLNDLALQSRSVDADADAEADAEVEAEARPSEDSFGDENLVRV
ncbi:hypothetical protein GGS21DRAFT_179053 [Xylaria nigripes]|nr:hypothetical protein GGS21DRAFT_179053 [Xylaria nigripes]